METATQLAAPRALGCDLVQGPFVAPPEIELRMAGAGAAAVRGSVR